MTAIPTRLRVAFWLRFAAIVPCLLALPVFLLAGWNVWAWALSAALLAVNIAVALGADLFARGRTQVMAVGIVGVSLISRAWLTFGALFVIAWTVDRQLGVAAAAAFLVYFTVDMVARSISHVLLRDEHGPANLTPEGSA
ncbi:MAG: hypothetical protein ACR2JV_05935 [Gaiellales bacterium]